MEQQNAEIGELAQIRRLMEQSSRFISLSGLSGIFMGTVALAGAAVAFFVLNYDARYFQPAEYFGESSGLQDPAAVAKLIGLAVSVLVLSLAGSIFFTRRKASKKGLPAWNRAARKMLGHLFLPLAAGGLFALVLLYHGMFYLVAPVTLIFYGLALVNASKFTLPELTGLGIAEIILGLLASLFAGYGLLFWAAGFGLLHIGYGIFMFLRYER